MNGFIIRGGNHLFPSSTDTGITENRFKRMGAVEKKKLVANDGFKNTVLSTYI